MTTTTTSMPAGSGDDETNVYRLDDRRSILEDQADPSTGRDFLMVDGEAVATWAADHPDVDAPSDAVRWVGDRLGRVRLSDRASDAVTSVRARLHGAAGLYRMLAWNSPRGLGRLIVRFGQWELDSGYKATKAAMERGDAAGDINKLNEHHDRKVKVHLSESLAGLAVLTAGGWWALVTYPVWLIVAVAAAVLAVLAPVVGWVGTDDPQSIIARVFRPVVVTPPVNEGLVVAALQNVPGPLGTTLSKDPGLMKSAWVQPPTRTKSGWEMVFDLPVGSVETCLLGDSQASALAAGLRRDPQLVWTSVVDASEGGHAGRCRLTVLRKPMRDGDMGSWPPVAAGVPRSAFSPAPVGVDQLGQLVYFPAVNIPCVLVGAIPKHGKTCFLIQYALGVVFDPRAELWVADGKADVDWEDVGDLVAHRFIKTIPGDPDDAVAALAFFRELDRELKNRRKAKERFRRETGISSSNITEEMANARIGLHPMLVIIDETQTYFVDIPDKEIREEIKGLIIRLAKQGRSFGVTMVLATQTIKDATIPTDVSGTAGGRIALKTAGHTQSQQILNAGCTAQGFKPEELKNLADAGIGYVAGDGMGTKLTRFFHLRDDAGEVRAAAEMARQFKIEAGTLTGYAAGDLDEDTSDYATFVDDLARYWPANATKVSHEVMTGHLATTAPDKYRDITPDMVSHRGRSHGLSTVDNCKGTDGKYTRKGFALTDIINHLERDGK